MELVQTTKNAMNILFLQSAHYSYDDRVWYHQRTALEEAGFWVDVCGKEELLDPEEPINWREEAVGVHAIITDTPRALWLVRNAKHTKLVYDITEWYPSKKNLRGLWLPCRWGKAFLMAMASLWAGFKADAFIFGEHYKAVPFRILFPRKPYIYLPYYPDLQYIVSTPPRTISRQCRLLYAGPLTAEKGYYRVLKVVREAQRRCPDTDFCLDIITNNPIATQLASGTGINYRPYLPFDAFCQTLAQYDLFLDLRDCDRENTRCLPIKLFYYMACGRPGIYSDLCAIRQGVPEFRDCLSLVHSAEEAADAIVRYVNTPALYQSHCRNARTLSQRKYNWGQIKHNLQQLLTDICQ